MVAAVAAVAQADKMSIPFTQAPSSLQCPVQPCPHPLPKGLTELALLMLMNLLMASKSGVKTLPGPQLVAIVPFNQLVPSQSALHTFAMHDDAVKPLEAPGCTEGSLVLVGIGCCQNFLPPDQINVCLRSVRLCSGLSKVVSFCASVLFHDVFGKEGS